MFEVALDSSWKALSSRTHFRGYSWLERKHKVAVLIRAFRSCRFCAGRALLAPSRILNFGNCCSEDLLYRFLSYCAIVSYQDARASGDTALSSPCWDLLATMCRVVNYHSSWARQRQVELFVASGCEGERRYRTLISLLGFVSHHAPSG
ncbi:hypothetical protein F511_34775 [Dorcoceras hygrometricum]|uniref:Uncharacterized protein n=1 Tax=Dorcoceras hygrometricum TaxID=472368 RepID=A0A2Z7C3L2_9LAMI|nr:hypothetical protein F511_34775 [Dorcoceras hygrometricum]